MEVGRIDIAAPFSPWQRPGRGVKNTIIKNNAQILHHNIPLYGSLHLFASPLALSLDNDITAQQHI